MDSSVCCIVRKSIDKLTEWIPRDSHGKQQQHFYTNKVKKSCNFCFFFFKVLKRYSTKNDLSVLSLMLFTQDIWDYALRS